MSLVGTPFLLLVTTALVVVTAAAVWAVPGWRRRWVRLAHRAVLVVVAQALAVLLAAVAVNDWGSFYGSWSDLFGSHALITSSSTGAWSTGPGSKHVVAQGAPAIATTGWSSPDQYGTRGELGSVELSGRLSGQHAHALVYLPPQYFQAAHAQDRFPAVEVFPGYPGDVKQLVTRMGFADALSEGIAAGRLRPMILVMLNPTLVPPRDTECTDVPHGPRVVTFLTRDVPADLRAHLRVTSAGWGAMGQSTGGYCATKLAMLDPHQFTTVVSLSGYYNARKDATTGDLWVRSTTTRDLNDLNWRLLHLPAPPINVLATIGSLEPGIEGLTGTQHFIRSVRPPMVARLIVVRNGGHNFGNYESVRAPALSWLSDHLTTSSGVLTPVGTVAG